MDVDKDFNLIIGLRIGEVREALQLTREQFSVLCGISDSFLAAVESGKKALRLKLYIKYVRILIFLPIILYLARSRALKQIWY